MPRDCWLRRIVVWACWGVSGRSRSWRTFARRQGLSPDSVAQSKYFFSVPGFEPGGREFESRPAHYKNKVLRWFKILRVSIETHMSQCNAFGRLDEYRNSSGISESPQKILFGSVPSQLAYLSICVIHFSPSFVGLCSCQIAPLGRPARSWH